MPEQWNWDSEGRRRYLADNLAAQRAGERKRLSRLLQERVDELNGRRQHDKLNDQRRQAGLGQLPYYPDPRNSTMLDSSKLYGRLTDDLYNRLTDSRMDERNMAFPVYNSQHERSLLEALNVTSVSLQYDTTVPASAVSPNSFDYRDDAATFTGVAITVAGTLTDKQKRLLDQWAQDRFGSVYQRSQPRLAATPVTEVPSTVVPVTFTERPAAK